MRLLDLHPVTRGLAVWDGSEWRFGPDALAACRVDPQATCWDVWEAISLIPLSGKRGSVRHRADLAALMLEPAPGPCAALAPASWEKEEMRVFLGSAAAASLSVRWLTSRAAAVVARVCPEAGACSVLEWSWTRLLQVHFSRDSEGQWTRGQAVSFADAGILACFRREALAVQDAALEKFRFDPLYSGRTEQALFSGWWRSLNENADWAAVSPGGGRLDLSPERSRFAGLHAAVLAGLEDDAGLIVPPPLRRMLAWSRATPEPPLGGEADVEDHDAPAARWRESLTLPGPAGVRATHLVIDGMAEPWAGSAAPGETVTLPDGRTALAVHVRERYGAP